MTLVTKRNGQTEELNLDKIHKIVAWACEGLKGVSESELELRAKLQFTDGIQTKDIHEMLIKSASELISLRSPDYQYVAGRLINYQLRKEVYGDYVPWHLLDIIKYNVGQGKYTAELLTEYSREEWNELNAYIDHSRDYNIAFAGMEQWRGKYLVKNRVTGQFYETPQVARMMIAAIGFMKYPKHYRLEYVKDFYDAISNFEINLPTPIMAGLRTPVKQFSSCVTIQVGDSLNSISAATTASMKYISQKAGLGLDVGKIRAINSEIRGGDAEHTGLIPFIRLLQSAVKSCSQGGVRGGAATVHIPVWHYEFPELVVLKNNRGTEFNRVRHLDYSFLFSRLMYERLIEGGNITLFSPSDVPGLLDAFYANQTEFKRLYEKYEADPTIRKRTLSALEIFTMFVTERKETGRIYFMNIDHANEHGSFIPERAPITQSNLCQEITLPTHELQDEYDTEGLISLCTLSAGNISKFKSKDDIRRIAHLTVRFLEELLDYQKYPIPAAEEATKRYRPLGIGVVNFAHWLAANNVGYDETAFELVDEMMEAWSYHLIEASVQLAEERGPCPGAADTKYSQGILPIHTYKKSVDNLVYPEVRYDWTTLAARVKAAGGLRHGTLMAQMPAETSAQESNSTNGIEPVRSLITEKVSKHGVLKQVVPEVRKLGSRYDLLWDHESPLGYMQLVAIMNKWMDQSISMNTSYNPQHYDDNELSLYMLIGDMVTAYQLGIKNGYYLNTYDGQAEEAEDLPLEDINEEDNDCGDVCKL